MTVAARQDEASAAPLPALRVDLVVEQRPGGLVHVQAPGAAQGFLLYDLEYSLARLLDGRRNKQQVLEGAGRLGIAATPDSLTKFFRQLAHYGFLQNTRVDRTAWPATVSNAEVFAGREPVLKLWSEQRYEEAMGYLEMLVNQTPDDEGLLQLHEMLQRHLMSKESRKATTVQLGASPASAPPARPSAPARAPEPEPEPQVELAEAPAPLAVEPEAPDQLLVDIIEQDPEAVARRARRRWGRRLVSLAVALGLVAVMPLVQCTNHITEPCELVPKSRAVVRSGLDSSVVEVLVAEGRRVQKGEVLVRLSEFEVKKRIERIDAQLARSKAERELLVKGARPAEVARARQLVGSKYREARLASARKKRVEALTVQQLATAEELDLAISDLASKEAAYSEANSTLILLTEGAQPEELAKRDAEIRGIEVERSLAVQALDATVLKSPIDGVVVTPKLQQKVGSAVSAGAAVVEVVDASTMIAEVYVPQSKVDMLKVGAPVRVKVANLPEQLFSGKVTFIGLAVERRGEPPAEYVRAESELDNQDGLLRPQVTGYAEIEAGSGSLGALLFQGIVRWVRYRFVV